MACRNTEDGSEARGISTPQDSTNLCTAFPTQSSDGAKRFIVGNLLARKFSQILTALPGALPAYGPLQRGFDSQPRFPSEFAMTIAAIDPKHMILTHPGRVITT